MNKEIQYVDIAMSDVPIYFSQEDGKVSSRDIIAFVRGKIEKNPWIPVILRTKDKHFMSDELNKAFIFWEGVNDNLIQKNLGIGSLSYCVIDIKDLDVNEPDYNIVNIVNKFMSDYDIKANVQILITGEDDSDSTKVNLTLFRELRKYIFNNTTLDVVFPNFVIKANKLKNNGFDISGYADDIAIKRYRNDLDSKYLDKVLGDLDGHITRGYTAIQDLKELRTNDVKLLSTYLNLKYDLPPAYIASFIAEYTAFGFLYPRTKLSMYEKLKFLDGVPPLVGYIGKDQSFNCYARIIEKIYPRPKYIFNINEKTVVDDYNDTFLLPRSDITILDFRNLFPDSKDMLLKETTGLVISNAGVGGTNNDLQSNMNLVNMFNELSSLVDDKIYISVKNSIIVVYNGVRYLLYMPSELAIDSILISEYFGQKRYLIKESDFNSLIDAQMERALLNRDRITSIEESSKALVNSWKGLVNSTTLKPAIPYEVTFYNLILPFYKNGLSFFDKCLRSYNDVFPIVTDIDSELEDNNPMFNFIDLASLRKDNQASPAISCCGTLIPMQGDEKTLPITFKSFSGKGLL